MANVTFKKGLLAALPSTRTEGTFYVTTDERAIYLDVDNSTRIRIGDFQEVANMEALQDITDPSTTALYYVTDLNVLAKYDGSDFVQINLDTGATSVEVVGSGNAVTQASYDPVSRKLTLTMGATYTTADDVDGAISTAVGDLGDKEPDVPYANVKEYVDEKIADVVAGSIEGLGALASKDKVAEGDLETTLATKINGKANIGTAEDTSDMDTLKGAKKYADEKATAAETHADEAIAALDVTDTPVANQLVSAVSETDGKIKVQRRALVAADIPEIGQEKVTGLTTALAGKQDALTMDGTYNAESNKVATQSTVTNAIGALNADGETAGTGEVISAVSEAGGVISVQKKSLTEADIPALSISKITDLQTTLNGKQDTLVFNTAYNASTNKAATMTDVQNAVEGLSGAMHYVGESTTDPSTGTATVEGHEDWASGDVVTYNAKEYVYDGENWRELGDESSYAVKGSIKNADIAADAAIDQSKIANLTTDLASKATPADITSAIQALDKASTAVATGSKITAIEEVDGIINVTTGAIVADDIPELPQTKITGLTTSLAGKQDTVTFNTTYDASSNKAATMADVNAAVTWGSFDDLT